MLVASFSITVFKPTEESAEEAIILVFLGFLLASSAAMAAALVSAASGLASYLAILSADKVSTTPPLSCISTLLTSALIALSSAFC